MTKHDDKIKTLLSTVENQKNNLGTKPRASWKTNGIFKYEGGSNYFNLNTVKEPQPLIDALATLLVRESRQDQAAHRLDAQAKPFEWDGYTIAGWEADFKLRIEILKWDAKKAQLEATQKKLKSLVSDEAKTEMELADIEKLLE